MLEDGFGPTRARGRARERARDRKRQQIEREPREAFPDLHPTPPPDSPQLDRAHVSAHLDALPWHFHAYKKTIDLTFALMLLPGLVLCIAILIVLNPFKNPGPIFFSQPRVGLNGRIFTILKFRTVVNPGTERQLSAEQRSELHPLGAFMRSTRIDEVPQILNVLKGDMSMIGPRPEQPALVEKYIQTLPGFDQRHLVKPGITGLAQLKHGYTDDAKGAKGKLRWDRVYLRYMGYRLETHLVRWTFRFIMGGLCRVFWRKLTFWRKRP